MSLEADRDLIESLLINPNHFQQAATATTISDSNNNTTTTQDKNNTKTNPIKTRNTRINQERIIMAGSLLLVCFTSIIQLAALQSLSQALFNAVYCFAYSIPTLSLALLHENWLRIHSGHEHFRPNKPFYLFFVVNYVLSCVIAMIGIGSLVWNFDIKIGIMFIITTLTCMFALGRWREYIDPYMYND